MLTKFARSSTPTKLVNVSTKLRFGLVNPYKVSTVSVCAKSFSTSNTNRNIFEQAKAEKLEAPGGKGETSSNPADLFKKNDILMYSDKPTNYIESVKANGYYLASKILIKSPNDEGKLTGALLLEGEAYEVDLLDDGYKLINGFIVEFDKLVLSLFEKIHPKPEILVVGLGMKSRVLSEANRKFFSGLGIQLEVGDSTNAASSFDMLATERPNVIGGLLLPPNV